MRSKGGGGWGVASMSLYERVQKGVLVGPSFTQGPKGWRGSSGSLGLKTLEKGKHRDRRETDGQRWVAWQVNREESTRFSEGQDIQIPNLLSPSSK